ncbi:neurogenic locus notch homolog protein 1-like isoform X3 [Crassostrea angulata]|uniref:neurogenic locus notch homolog protein 1-like isoform X3 n=1 Tax=Magallana angulata TaxID=2784310 RepID=UPI0022B095C6|nr:neurogenic locus notch homolog protein 1-like isoform X3 [Crassostrea angulata]
MKGLLRLAVLLAVGVFFAMAKPSPPPPPPQTEDLQLRSFLRALENYISKKSVNTDGRLRSNGGQDNSLERDELSPSDEEEAESQSVLIGNKEVKPKNLHPNKEQEKDDSKDKHPLPPVVGIKKAIETRNFGISKSVLWPGGVIPYELSADTFGSRYSKALALVENTAANISRTTCVKWRPKTSADQYFVKITGDQNGCYSYVGNIKRDNGQDLNLGDGCLDEYVVLHEMHHAMGGLHEQQRNRRKYFVKITWENIVSNYNDQYALNMHTKNNEVYDYASILQYHLTAFTSNGKATMTIPDQNLEFLISESKYDLSFYDMAEVNKEYGCPSASCTVSCQNEGFRMQALDQSTCHCHCPSGLKGATCDELDTDAGCGKTIVLSNGGSEEISMTSYSSGKSCTWLVKAESDSLIKATVTSVDLPFSSQDDCYHWIELRYYLIGDKGKEICGKSTTPRTYSQTNTGEASPFLIRFNSQKTHTPGAGFTVKVEAVKSGCISSPCKTGSLCTEGSGDGSYTCSCQNGLSGKNCDEFRAPSYNLCNLEEDFGTCLFDQDPSSDILWSFNTRLCSWNGCSAGTITRGSGYQFLTMTPYYDSVQWDYGSKAVLKTTARFTAVDRCLSFVYSLGSFEDRGVQTELNVYVEGTGKTKTKVKNLKTTTNYSWKTETVSIEAVENLVISIEGVMGPQLLGVDNISLRPGLCTNTPCSPNPCINGGTCDESNPPTGSKYVCTCPTGFSGDRCENSQTSNPCDSNTCQNGATCVADATKTDGYRCDCATGFTGDKCEMTTNPCSGNTCRNGATCVADATKTEGYRCDCATGFTGDKCEIPVTSNPCEGNNCQNSATCIADATKTVGYRCDCATGFTGDECEIQNYCVDFPCKNGGTCTSGKVTFSCQCPSDYTGPTCNTSLTTDHCDPHPCQNGGSCFSYSFGYYCSCPPGFSGDECEITIPSDHCSSSPCQNGGSCVETPDEQNPYRCDCEQGFPGRNCEGRVCVFEEDYDSACFLDTDPSAWHRSSAGSSVTAFEGHHYLYLDTSWLSSWDNNYFYDKNIAFEDKDYCLTFAYYMSGEDVGDLMVFTYKDDYQVHFKKQGTQGNQWHRAHLDIHLDQETFIGFQGTEGSSGHYFIWSNSLIAMDDIKLMPNRCP